MTSDSFGVMDSASCVDGLSQRVLSYGGRRRGSTLSSRQVRPRAQILWLLPCPPGEDKSHDEGAEHSGWASVILSVAVSSGERRLRVGRRLLSGEPDGHRVVPHCILNAGAAHAAMPRDAPCALQRRSPPAQSRPNRRVERGDVRRVQQPELPRPQLRARHQRRGRDRPRTGYVMDVDMLKRPGRGAGAPAPRPQEPEPRRGVVRDLNPTSENIAVVFWRELRRAVPDELALQHPSLGNTEELCGLRRRLT